MKKDLLSIADLSKEEIYNFFLRSKEFLPILKGKILALVFEKPSLRTRVTFEVAIHQLGGSPIYLGPTEIGLGKREAVKDVARNLSLWVSGIIARVFSHSVLQELAQESSVPVINALSDLEHPCQVLSDFLTIYEISKNLAGIKIAWIGDGNNVCHSLILGAGILGAHLKVATPKGYEPKPEIVQKALEFTKESGAKIEITNDPKYCVRDAEFIYTDVWISMGEEMLAPIKRLAFSDFQVNERLLRNAPEGYKIMHCLPAHRGEEITDEILDGPNSIVLKQAENRLQIERAILAAIL